MPEFVKLSNKDHYTAQAELDDKMFSHYVLGRCLAMEEVFRAFLETVPPAKRKAMQKRFEQETNVEMLLAEEEGHETLDEAKRYVMRAGFIHAMIMMGF